jgi:hypothetical protein
MSGLSGFTSVKSPIVSLSEFEVRTLLGVEFGEVTCTSGDNVMTANGYVSVDTSRYCLGCEECDPCEYACHAVSQADPKCESHANF